MEAWQIIIAVILLIIAAIILNYVNKTRKKEGPILSQAYLSLSKEEREFFDTDREYERITILYGLIGFFFIFIAVAVLTINKIFAFIAIGLLLTALIYSIIKLIELRLKK